MPAQWTPEQDARLLDLVAAGTSRHDTAKAMHISVNSADKRARRLGVKFVIESTWTAEKVELLRRYVAEGMFPQAIADQFGYDRKSVYDKCHRLGLYFTKDVGGRRSTTKPKLVANSHSGTFNPSWTAAEQPVQPSPDLPEVLSPNEKNWEDRAPRECAFPTRVFEGVTYSCCNSIRSGTAYCGPHFDRMFQPLGPQRDPKAVKDTVRAPRQRPDDGDPIPLDLEAA